MNCPECDDKVHILPWKGNSLASDNGFVNTLDVTPRDTFKCCNKSCWVTRIEVDWGQS